MNFHHFFFLNVERSDDLNDTVDYGQVFKMVKGIMEGPPAALLEFAAGRIAQSILAQYATIDQVWVRTSTSTPRSCDFPNFVLFSRGLPPFRSHSRSVSMRVSVRLFLGDARYRAHVCARVSCPWAGAFFFFFFDGHVRRFASANLTCAWPEPLTLWASKSPVRAQTTRSFQLARRKIKIRVPVCCATNGESALVFCCLLRVVFLSSHPLCFLHP